MEEKRSNEPSKVGTFVSSAVSRILNLIMILVIIALAALVAWFWHNNQLLEQKVEGLQDDVEKFEKMNLGGGGRDVVVKEEVKNDENIITENEETVIGSKEVTTNTVVNNDLITYKNDELGISFEYPDSLGELSEEWYKTIELLRIKFLDNEGKHVNFSLENAQYKKIRTCEDILNNGFNNGDRGVANCKTLNVDGRDMVFFTFGPSRFGGSYMKVVDFQTKKGVWRFYIDSDNVDSQIDIIKTIKYF